MYYPYLRGKQYELIMLREMAEFIEKNSIHPIIEPVKSDFKAIIRAFDELNKNKVPCTLIVNPKAGQNPVELSNILDELIEGEFKEYKYLSIGF